MFSARDRITVTMAAAPTHGSRCTAEIDSSAPRAWTTGRVCASIANSADPSGRLRDDLGALAQPAWNTAWLGVTAAVLAVLVAAPAAAVFARASATAELVARVADMLEGAR